MLKRFFLLATVLAVSLATTARADIVFSDGNTGSLDDENVLFGTTPEAGSNLVQGFTNQTNTFVDFNSNDLIHGNGGQALVEGCSDTNGPNDSCQGTFNDLIISLTNPPGGNFGSVIFNLNAAEDGDVTISAVDGFGNTFQASSSLQIDPLSSSDQNFYTVVAINGQDIQSVTITSTVGLNDVRQIRLGAASGDTQAVPEPTSILLFGTLAGGVCMIYRKRFASV